MQTVEGHTDACFCRVCSSTNWSKIVIGAIVGISLAAIVTAALCFYRARHRSQLPAAKPVDQVPHSSLCVLLQNVLRHHTQKKFRWPPCHLRVCLRQPRSLQSLPSPPPPRQSPKLAEPCSLPHQRRPHRRCSVWAHDSTSQLTTPLPAQFRVL